MPDLNKIAIWAITPQGADLACRIAAQLSGAELFVSARLESSEESVTEFTHLADAVAKRFESYAGHLFIMSTGIVVRLIAAYIRNKMVDPAVVVMDEKGRFAISLLAGHIGGANRLTRQIAQISGAEAVITTATDVNRLPAIDVLAQENDLYIENPPAIKNVNMAIVSGREIFIHDPFQILACGRADLDLKKWNPWAPKKELPAAGIFVDDKVIDLPARVLVLRPKSLAVGVGCNRGTSSAEITALFETILQTNNLSRQSVGCLASIDLKRDETGLLVFAKTFKLPLLFFGKSELNQVETIQSPSAVVEKHIGVKSVCEAAAILAAHKGKLVVPKALTPNVTMAVARISFTS